MKTKMDHPLFDALIAENPRVRNDADLCRVLEVQPPNLSKMRNRKMPVSDSLRVAVMRKFRWSIKRLDELAPPEPSTHQQEATH